MKKRVGIFGGTFDPPHLGHVNLALSLKEAAGLDRVLFVPARRSPFKQAQAPLASETHRLHMVQAAIQAIPGFEVLDSELKAPAPSYTIETVKYLAQDPTLELHLLLADDAIATFSEWKEADLLIQLAPPLIGSRSKGVSSPWGRVIPTPCFEISSTQIRQRLAEHKYCGHLLRSSVLNYIQQHKLYAP